MQFAGRIETNSKYKIARTCGFDTTADYHRRVLNHHLNHPILPVIYASVNSCFGFVNMELVSENSTNSPSQNRPV